MEPEAVADRLFVVIFPAATIGQPVDMSLLGYLHADGPSDINNDGSVFLKVLGANLFSGPTT